MREIKTIIVHCADTYPDMDIGVDEIHEWHTSPPRNWSDIGYHWVIRRSGVLEHGRPEHIAGAHAAGHNKDSIGVCMVGGKSRKDDGPEDNFTPEQRVMLRELIGMLRKRYGDSVEVIPHSAVNEHKTCPNCNIYEILCVDHAKP